MKFRMTDGTICDTTSFRRHWHDDRYWNGWGVCSRSTGCWFKETLFLDYVGRYFLLTETPKPSCEWLTNNEAARWLLANGYAYAVQVRRLAAA